MNSFKQTPYFNECSIISVKIDMVKKRNEVKLRKFVRKVLKICIMRCGSDMKVILGTSLSSKYKNNLRAKHFKYLFLF